MITLEPREGIWEAGQQTDVKDAERTGQAWKWEGACDEPLPDKDDLLEFVPCVQKVESGLLVELEDPRRRRERIVLLGGSCGWLTVDVDRCGVEVAVQVDLRSSHSEGHYRSVRAGGGGICHEGSKRSLDLKRARVEDAEQMGVLLERTERRDASSEEQSREGEPFGVGRIEAR